MAHEMLIQEMAPLQVLKKKIDNMDYEEEIPIGNANVLHDYEIVGLVDERDSQTDMDVVQLLNVNCQKIIHETTSLEEHKLKLSGNKRLVFDYVEQNIR